jgi:RHS repeat-associated protein
LTIERLQIWNADNRLAQVSAAGATTSYAYNPDGGRISSSGPDGTTHYFSNLFEVKDPGGAATLVKYYYAGDLLIARQEAGTKLWYHTDHLGSVRAMTDATGAVAVSYEYAVFGDTVTTTGSQENVRGFGSHWRDDESHMLYMGARYQDPVLGRFTQPDPLIPEPEDPQSWNRYSYTRNNPFNRVDPTGNADEEVQEREPEQAVSEVRVSETAPSQGGPTAVSARAEGNDVIIVFSDGTEEVRSGGSRSFRNNNPGNLRNFDFSKRNGSIGEAGGFAVFPNEATGQSALTGLLETKTYQALSISDAISRFAPSVENNTKNYQTFIRNATGLDGSTALSTLNKSQLTSVANAIRRFEGFFVGTVTTRTPE